MLYNLLTCFVFFYFHIQVVSKSSPAFVQMEEPFVASPRAKKPSHSPLMTLQNVQVYYTKFLLFYFILQLCIDFTKKIFFRRCFLLQLHVPKNLLILHMMDQQRLKINRLFLAAPQCQIMKKCYLQLFDKNYVDLA